MQQDQRRFLVSWPILPTDAKKQLHAIGRVHDDVFGRTIPAQARPCEMAGQSLPVAAAEQGQGAKKLRELQEVT